MPNIVKLNKDFLSGAAEVGIEIIPPATEPDIIAAFANNSSFPYRQINLGKISAKAEAGHEIKFGDGAGKVAFTAGGNTATSLGVYPDPQKMLDDLGIAESIARA